MKCFHLLAVLGALALVACGSDSSGPAAAGGSSNTGNNGNAGSGNNTPAPGMASEDVTAAEGGEVALDDGAAVNIPAGALADDTTITIESSEPSNDLPDLDSVTGLVYEFGPDGTTFEQPVELTLPLVGTPDADEEAVVSWLNTDTNRWEDLQTTAGTDTVTAETTHFTLFVVRFKGVAADAVTCDFAACTGGNIVGSWDILGACIDFANPFEELCADSTFEADTEFTGSFTFNDDGTYTSTITTGGTLNVVLPASCLTQLTGGQTVACTELGLFDSDENGGGTCTGDTSTGCNCSGPLEGKTEENSGTYSVEGSTLTTTDSEGTDTTTICINGDSLKAQGQDEGEDGGAPTIFTWSAQRQ
jgi:hypothetical protein